MRAGQPLHAYRCRWASLRLCRRLWLRSRQPERPTGRPAHRPARPGSPLHQPCRQEPTSGCSLPLRLMRPSARHGPGRRRSAGPGGSSSAGAAPRTSPRGRSSCPNRGPRQERPQRGQCPSRQSSTERPLGGMTTLGESHGCLGLPHPGEERHRRLVGTTGQDHGEAVPRIAQLDPKSPPKDSLGKRNRRPRALGSRQELVPQRPPSCEQPQSPPPRTLAARTEYA